MNNCKMCGTSIPEGVNECPNCKFKVSSSKNINRLQKGIKGYFGFIIGFVVIIFVITIFMFIFIGGKGLDIFNKANNGINNENILINNDNNIELLEGTKITYNNFYFIEGTLKNNDNKDIKNIKVTFTLYNENGSLVDTKWELATLIEANGTWKFKINCGFDKPNSFKLKSIEVL